MVLAAGVRTKVDILISWTFYLVESYNDIMIIIISLNYKFAINIGFT